MAQQSASNVGRERDDRDRGYVQRFAETKPSTKTTELIVWALTVIGILIAAALVGADAQGEGGFGATDAWRYIAFVSIGYMVSRGLAKAGSQQPQDS
ncbi:hypothetical protein [Rubrobacter indicoceani]|uniref:hypothetical protein n=1 Tax=Rubrobacter indicoceani TaxID=2051957 RepID=UPI000E5B4F82|nr:hypothetical protein [Rubrobacter indicoceani]